MQAKILIVHDQRDFLEKAKNALTLQHHVTTSSGIQDAIIKLKELEEAHLDTVPLDLVLCSVHLESSSAFTIFDLLKWIRGNPQIKKVPFLMVCFQPGAVGQLLTDSIRLAGASLGASGYATLEEFETEKFVDLVNTYLPEEYRVEHSIVDENFTDFSPTEANRKQELHQTDG